MSCLHSNMDKWCQIEIYLEKTEFTVIGDRQAKESIIQKFPTQFLRNSVSLINEFKNFGVTFNSGNTFASHISKVCHACYYHLKHLRHIRKFLSVETVALLANSMISSQIDICNSLFYGVNKYNVAKLQKIQNALCRIVFRLDKTSHVTLQKTTLARHFIPYPVQI